MKSLYERRSATAAVRADELVGVWELREVRESWSDGEQRPGSRPITGYLTYDSEGIATVVIGANRHVHLDAGEYTVDESSMIVHDLDLVLYPEWPRGPFTARANLVGDLLTLRTSPCTTPDGRTLLVALVWSRLS